jgi:hypothetical protein
VWVSKNATWKKERKKFAGSSPDDSTLLDAACNQQDKQLITKERSEGASIFWRSSSERREKRICDSPKKHSDDSVRTYLRGIVEQL